MSEQELDSFIAAGFTKEQVLEVIAIVAASTITNYPRTITNPPLEDPFRQHTGRVDGGEWNPEESAAHAAPIRYSINVTLDGCYDHRAMFADEDLHRHAIENLDQARCPPLWRVTYEMMEAAFRPPARTVARPFGPKPNVPSGCVRKLLFF